MYFCLYLCLGWESNSTSSVPVLDGLFRTLTIHLKTASTRATLFVNKKLHLQRRSFHFVQSVPREGVEPSCLAAYDFESYVYTNSTTEAAHIFLRVSECTRKATKIH